jgi:hypothetical protein
VSKLLVVVGVEALDDMHAEGSRHRLHAEQLAAEIVEAIGRHEGPIMVMTAEWDGPLSRAVVQKALFEGAATVLFEQGQSGFMLRGQWVSPFSYLAQYCKRNDVEEADVCGCYTEVESALPAAPPPLGADDEDAPQGTLPFVDSVARWLASKGVEARIVEPTSTYVFDLDPEPEPWADIDYDDEGELQ